MTRPTHDPDLGPTPDPLRDPAFTGLIAFAPIKVWSMVVTIMGDLCRNPDDRITGQALGRIMGDMGVANQTLRVALHRLKRDGWIEALREGRSSSYALTPSGRARTEAVRPILYATGAPEKRPVFLILGDPHDPAAAFETALSDDATLLAPRLALSTDRDAPPDALVQTLQADQTPAWIIAEIAPPDLMQDYALLGETLRRIDTVPADPLDALTLRLLALHHWRRLRLRHGALPDLVLGDWPGARARSEVTRLLARLPRPTLDSFATLAAP